MEIGSEMDQSNPVPQDMFDKAREAFFGTTEPSPKSCASSIQPLEPQDAQNAQIEDFGSTPVKQLVGSHTL
jgi:hypothetical protein